jgi:sporulation protein YlmC with PRC-barrel domain
MNYEERDTFGIYDNTIAIDDTVRQRNKGPGPYLMGADTLLGNDVVNAQEEDLGDIKEIMLDMRTGRVSYAVLSFGGFLGMGEKLFAVPWSALKLDTVHKRFVLDASKDRLESAPGFDKNDWPDMADTAWEKGVHDFYGTRPYVEPRGV